MFQTREAAAAEILAFTATATPEARQMIMDALNSGKSARQVAKIIRNAKARAASGRF